MLAPVLSKRVFVVLTAALLTACTQSASDAPLPVAAEAAGATPSSQQVEAPAAVDPYGALAVNELKELATLTLRDQQLHTPAGANAIEYYLALRQRNEKPDESVESALFDLMPYAVIAAEQSLSGADLENAVRLRDLIERIDRSAPSLPRLDEKIAEGHQEMRLAQQRANDAEMAAAASAAIAAAIPSTSTDAAKASPQQPAVAPVTVAPTRPIAPSSGSSAGRQSTMTAQPNDAQEATIAAAPARTTSALVAIRTPEPTFPPEAFRQRKAGSVEVEFRVNPDGSVSDVRVLNSSHRVFERNVVLAVRRWQFTPLAEPMTVRRKFNFNAPG